jgi:hypothetical protein
MGSGASAAGMAPTPGMGAASLGISDAPSMGSLSNNFTQSNDAAMGLGKLDSAFADQKTSGSDWKSSLQKGLMAAANTQLGDIQAPTGSAFTPRSSSEYNQSALQQGYRNSDFYNQLMQQQLANQVRRYKNGV